MISESTMYWITICDSIGLYTFILSIISLFATILIGIGSFADENEDNCKRLRKILPFVVTLFFVCSFTCAVIPHSKQAAAITILPRIINNQNIDKEDRIYKLAVKWLEDLNKKEDKKKDDN